MSFEKLNVVIEKEAALFKALDELAKTEFAPALQEAVKEFKTQTPELAFIKIRGYKPSFNDGEPCYWGIYGVEAIFGNSVEDENLRDEDGLDLDYDLQMKETLTEDHRKLFTEFKDSINSLGGDGGTINRCFDPEGYGVTIIINIQSGVIETEECYHD